MGGQLEQQGGEIAVLEEPGAGVAQGRQLEHGSDGEQLVVDRDAKRCTEYAHLITHRTAGRALGEPAFEILPNPGLRDLHRTNLDSEKPLQVSERLLGSAERA